jgi:hypothetical protein
MSIWVACSLMSQGFKKTPQPHRKEELQNQLSKGLVWKPPKTARECEHLSSEVI